MARSQAPLLGVVSFHGGLSTPAPAKEFKASILACHGSDDPHVPASEVTGFEEEMRKAGADWQLIIYGGAVHGFTNPASGTDRSKGVAYDPRGDRRSWGAMQQFLNETFSDRPRP
jgi:dienelactone hydrolase